MKTEDLIAALAADTNISRPRLVQRMGLGIVLSVALLLAFWHLRADLLSALGDPRILAKFALPLFLAAIAWALRSRPDRVRPLWPLAVPALLAALLFVATMPDSGLRAEILGSSWRVCLMSIPFLALPIGAGIFAALRRSVVVAPARDGLVAGLSAGACATAIYALHCTEDAPAFFAIWYTLGILICGLAGSLAGRRLLGV